MGGSHPGAMYTKPHSRISWTIVVTEDSASIIPVHGARLTSGVAVRPAARARNATWTFVRLGRRFLESHAVRVAECMRTQDRACGDACTVRVVAVPRLAVAVQLSQAARDNLVIVIPIETPTAHGPITFKQHRAFGRARLRTRQRYVRPRWPTPVVASEKGLGSGHRSI